MKAIGEGRNSAAGLSPWDGGVGILPRGLGGRCGLVYQLVFLLFLVRLFAQGQTWGLFAHTRTAHANIISKGRYFLLIMVSDPSLYLALSCLSSFAFE
jgi:hypothetical protein